MMKIKIIILSLLASVISTINVSGQTDVAFSNVPVVNGKVVFQQFIPNAEGVDAVQQYKRLQQWGRDRFQGNPLLSGIRFDDKGRTITISSGEELQVRTGNSGSSKMTMRYRFNTSVTNAGYMLVVRDITYQSEQPKNASSFPKTYTAEQMITDQAVNTTGEDNALRSGARNATLNFLNELYAELSAL